MHPDERCLADSLRIDRRVAALAGSGEILATDATLTEAQDIVAVGRREATVKSVSAPVPVAAIVWA